MNFATPFEIDLNELSKSWWVIIFECFRVSKCFKQRIWIKDLLFNIIFSHQIFSLIKHVLINLWYKICVGLGQIAQDDLSCFSFTSTTLPRYYYWLVFVIYKHILVRFFSHHKQVWLWSLVHWTTWSYWLAVLSVLPSNWGCEYFKFLIRVDW